MTDAPSFLKRLAADSRAGLLRDINAALARQEAEIADAESRLKALAELSDETGEVERRTRRLRVRIDVGIAWSLKLRLMKVRLESKAAGQDADANTAAMVDMLESELAEAVGRLPRRVCEMFFL